MSRYAYLVSLLPWRITEELGRRVRLARRAVSSYTPDPRTHGQRGLLIHGTDVRITRESLTALTGGEAAHAAWQLHQARMRRIAKAVFPTLTEPLPSRAQLRELVADDEAWDAVFERPLAEKLLPSLGDDLLAGVVLTDALIGTFASAADTDLRQNRCLLYHVIGRGSGEWLVPVGGMGALTRALADAAQAGGAEVRTDVEVTRLEPDAHGADVTFTDGARESAVRTTHVLVNAAPAELERLLAAISDSPAYDAPPAPREPPPEGSQLKLNMVLSRLPRLRDPSISPEQAFAGTFHVNETAEQLQRAYEEAASGSVPETPPCEAYCHTLTDPSILGAQLRASGAHTLTVFALHMPARLFANDRNAARLAALDATLRSIDSVLAEPLADCLLADADGNPCLELHTPLDIERELRMPGGHIFHRDLAWPFAETEEQVGTWGVETPHPAILLCGAGARRGGAISGIPGRNAAMAILAS